MNASLTLKMLRRGDYIAIESGRLVIRLDSGKDFTTDLMKQHSDTIIKEIAERSEIPIYQYQSYAVGHYTSHKASGITLNYIDLFSFNTVFVTYNADLTRDRTTKHGKKGTRLPGKQFRVGPLHAFPKFWKSLGLEQPRYNVFHDRMGKLKSVLVTCKSIEDGKLDKESTGALDITHSQLIKTFGIKTPALNSPNKSGESADNFRITSGEGADNSRIRTADKETQQPHTEQGLQPDESACASKCVTKVTKNKETKDYVSSSSNVIPITNNPLDQTKDEWLSDYENA